jgi:hypothetical protein
MPVYPFISWSSLSATSTTGTEERDCLRNADYNYNTSYIYFDTFKGMCSAFFTFGLCGYYGSLSHSIISLCKVYNARQRLGKMYIALPIVFAFVCLATSTFLLQDIGIKDLLVDGITDGSLSELLHVVVIFILVPYTIYSIGVVYIQQRKMGGQNQQQPVLESGMPADKDLFVRHIMYIVVFLVTIMPGCLAELLPMLWKTIPRSISYKYFANIAAIFFSCSGIGVSIIRLYDPYVKHKIQSAISAAFGANFEEVGADNEGIIGDPGLSEILPKTVEESPIATRSEAPSRARSDPPRKNVFEQAEERAVYDVFRLFCYLD